MDHYVELMLDHTQVRLSLEDDLQQANALWQSSDHNHAVWELHILLQGTCHVDIDRSDLLLKSHQALLIAPGQFHRTSSAVGELERFSMTFSLKNGTLPRGLQTIVPGYRIYDVTEEIESLCRAIFEERSNRNLFRRTALQNLTSLLLIRNFSLLQISDTQIADPPAPRKYTELIDAFFERSAYERVTMDDLAQELHLSRNHVNRILKKYYGASFREKLIRTRMARATWLLRHTDQNIDRVAEAVGYASVPTFHEMFHRHLGMTPQQYRKRIQQEETDHE